MKISEELRKQQLAVTADFKSRAQKAEKILGEIDVCQNKLASLNEALSAVLGIDAVQAKKAAKPPKAKSAKTKVASIKAAKPAKVAKTVKAKPAAPATVATKPPAAKNKAPMLKNSVRDFLLKAGKPMKIAEIVKAMKKAGHVFQAKKPVKTMTNLMYNHAKVFKRVRPGTFKAV